MCAMTHSCVPWLICLSDMTQAVMKFQPLQVMPHLLVNQLSHNPRLNHMYAMTHPNPAAVGALENVGSTLLRVVFQRMWDPAAVYCQRSTPAGFAARRAQERSPFASRSSVSLYTAHIHRQS